MIRFDILVNDSFEASSRRRAEHGLAIYAEVTLRDGRGEERILLDTGQHVGNLRDNIGGEIDLGRLTAVVLSHGHYDHSGGLGLVEEAGARCPVYVGPDVARRRFSVQMGADGTLGRMRKQIGMPSPELLERLDVRRVGGIVRASECMTLFTIPTSAPPNVRLLAADMASADTFSDEVFALITDGSEEWLFGGCTHHGLPMVLEYVFGTMGRERLSGFIGGLHLQGRPKEEIEDVAEIVGQYEIGAWRPMHCTGEMAQEIWRERFRVVG